MALAAVQSIPGAPVDLAERIEAAHAALHETRCQTWLTATGNRPTSPYAADRQTPVTLDGRDGPVPVARLAEPVRGESCKFHPVTP